MTLLEQLTQLEELAKTAQIVAPGDWTAKDCWLQVGEEAPWIHGHPAENAHIAACSPQTILALCEKVRTLHAKLALLRRYHSGDGSVTREQVIDCLNTLGE